MKPRNSRGAMEMTMGTVVTIVLLVAVLIVVLFFIAQVRDTGTNAISGIDTAIQSEINKLFSDDSSKKIVIIPSSRIVDLKKGDDGLGFGFSIRNVDDTEGDFNYVVNAVETSCPQSLSVATADGYIKLGKSRSSIPIPAGSAMENAIHIGFTIPESAPPCQIRYAINVGKGGTTYIPPVEVTVVIKSS